MKKIIFELHHLKMALNFTAKVINKNTVLPILEGYLFQAEKGVVKITTTDLETTVTKAIPAEFREAISFVLYPDAAAFIHSLKEPTVSFEISKVFGLQINGTNCTGKFMLEEPTQFPKLKTVTGTAHVVTDDFQAAMTRSLKYVSNDDLRPAMTGVFFESNRIAATDAHRMYYYDHSLGLPHDFICIPKAVAMATKLKDCKMKVEVIAPTEGDLKTAETSGVHVAFYNNSTMIVSRSIDARFPDYKVVIPNDNHVIWNVDKKAFLEILGQVVIAANTSTSQVCLTIEKDETILSAQDVDFSREATARINSTCNEFPFQIAFNSNFLKGIIADCQSDNLEMRFKGGTRAAVMQQEGELHLLMPLMLNDGNEAAEKPKHSATKAEAVETETGDSDLKDDDTEDEPIEVEELQDDL